MGFFPSYLCMNAAVIFQTTASPYYCPYVWVAVYIPSMFEILASLYLRDTQLLTFSVPFLETETIFFSITHPSQYITYFFFLFSRLLYFDKPMFEQEKMIEGYNIRSFIRTRHDFFYFLSLFFFSSTFVCIFYNIHLICIDFKLV